MAVAASQTTNPVLLALMGGVIAFVVAARRSDAPWSRSLVVFFRLGLFVIAIRVVLQVVFGQRLPGHVLFTLPQVPLPSWAAGVSIGGAVTAESLLLALCEGMRLAVILLAFGAANSLASPYRLLRCLPAILYEAGVAVTVALAFAPELVLTIRSVRQARRLRGRPTRGIAGIRGMAVPVLEGALDRSLQLASSMDARGYGRRSALAPVARRTGTVATVVGFFLVAVGIYDTLSTGTPSGLGIGALVGGIGLLLAGMVVSGRRNRRTRYRPDPWRAPEWVVTLAGLVVALGMVGVRFSGETGLQVHFSPLTIPSVPLLACLGILVGIVPAVAAPVPPSWAPRSAPERRHLKNHAEVEPVGSSVA